jgi:hypothetical protein
MFLPNTSSQLVCCLDGASVPVPPFVTEQMKLACAYARAVARCALGVHMTSRLDSAGPLPPAMTRLQNRASQSVGTLCNAWSSMVSTRHCHRRFQPRFPGCGALLLTLRFFFSLFFQCQRRLRLRLREMAREALSKLQPALGPTVTSKDQDAWVSKMAKASSPSGR